MLSIHELRKVTWRRQSADREYAGYIAVTDEAVRLLGCEEATGINASLTIPHPAVVEVRFGTRELTLEIADGDAIVVHVLEGEVAALAGRIARASRPPAGRAPARTEPAPPASPAAASA